MIHPPVMVDAQALNVCGQQPLFEVIFQKNNYFGFALVIGGSVPYLASISLNKRTNKFGPWVHDNLVCSWIPSQKVLRNCLATLLDANFSIENSVTVIDYCINGCYGATKLFTLLGPRKLTCLQTFPTLRLSYVLQDTLSTINQNTTKKQILFFLFEKNSTTFLGCIFTKLIETIKCLEKGIVIICA